MILDPPLAARIAWRTRVPHPELAPGEKWCRECGTGQPLAAFGRHRYRPDGLDDLCLHHTRARNQRLRRARGVQPRTLVRYRCMHCGGDVLRSQLEPLIEYVHRAPDGGRCGPVMGEDRRRRVGVPARMLGLVLLVLTLGCAVTPPVPDRPTCCYRARSGSCSFWTWEVAGCPP